MKKLNNKRSIMFGMATAVSLFGLIASAQEPATQPPGTAQTANSDAEGTGMGVASVPPPVPQFQAVDADNQSVILNKIGVITLLLGTSEDSQNAARAAGKAMYPFQGRHDFQLVVVVDLRDSLATWVPSVTLNQMRSNLDQEAVELKPYYLKNGNKSDPRKASEVVADFNGTTSSLLGWTASSEDLRGILYGADGREIKRWTKIDDMNKLQADVKMALDALVAAKRIHQGTTSKGERTSTTDPSQSPEGQSQPPVALPVDPSQLPPPRPSQD